MNVIAATAKRALKTAYARAPFKQPLFEVARRAMKLPEPIYKHLHFQGVFTTTIPADKPGGRTATFRMRHDGYQIENELFWGGIDQGHEKTSMGLWRRLCERAQVIVDVGANTGIYSLVAKAVNPGARVYAFEPLERICQTMRHNLQLNDFDVVVEPLALSNFAGEATVYDVTEAHTYSVTVNKNLHAPGVEVIERKIRTITLDQYIADKSLPRIDLIKIDVETHEPEVLEGFSRNLGRMRPAMLIEILNDKVASAVEILVKDAGYLYFNIDERTDRPVRAAHLSRSAYFNFLLCSEEEARLLGLI